MKPISRSLLALSVLALASASGNQQSTTHGRWPAFPASVRYDGGLAKARISIGLMVPRADPKKLYSLLPKDKLERFLADRKSGQLVETPVALEERDFDRITPWGLGADHLRAAAHAIEKAFGVEVVCQEILADDCAQFPLVIVPARRLAKGEAELVQAYVAAGGIVCVPAAKQEHLDRLAPGCETERLSDNGLGLLALVRANRTSDDPKAVVDALDKASGWEKPLADFSVVRPARRGLIVGVPPFHSGNRKLQAKLTGQLIALAAMTSRRVRDITGPALAIRGAERDGDQIEFTVSVPEVVRARRASLDARVVDVDGKVHWREAMEPSNGSRAKFRFPKDLDACASRLQVTWTFGNVELFASKTIQELVGIVNRQVFTSNRILAGSTHAVRVYHAHTKTFAPVAGQRTTVKLTRKDQTIAEATAVSDESGTAVLELRVPEDVEPGTAQLEVGEFRFHAGIVSSRRISLVPDRSIYRETDTVNARMLVHRFPSGKPAAGASVTLRMVDGRNSIVAEKKVTTSDWGIAAASFSLVDATPGDYALVAICGDATVEREFAVSAFELPRFKLEASPAKITCKPGEPATVRITSTYVDGAPVKGARVSAVARGFRAKFVTGKTGDDGSFEYRVEGAERSGSIGFVVTDADGRTRALTVPLELDASGVKVEIRRLSQVVHGRPARLELTAYRVRDRAPVSGTAAITISGKRLEAIELRDGRAAFEATVRDWLFAIRAELATAEHGVVVAERTLSATPVQDGHPLVVVPRLVSKVGQTTEVEILATDGPVMLDVLRDGTQLRALHAIVKDGVAKIPVELADDMVGTLDLYAYRLASGKPEGTRQRIFVARGRGLEVAATPVAKALKPGDTAIVDVEVKDENGEPTAAALGYWAVDSALDEIAKPAIGDERYFDVVSDDANGAIVDMATGKSDFEAALGLFGPPQKHDQKFTVRHDLLEALEQRVKNRAATAFRKRLTELRKTFLAAVHEMPLAEVRRWASFQQFVRGVLERGAMSEGEFVDPWGRPLQLWIGWGDHGWSSRHGFTEAVAGSWSGWDLWKALPLDLRVLVQLVRQSLAEDVVEEVEEEVWNDVVGLGGGAGGKFGGRAGRRVLSSHGAAATANPARTREDFRPTLCFVPETIVGPSGRTRLEIPIADSLTTWRMRLVASDVRGAVGVDEARLVVTQPLAIEPWVARFLTVGDRVELPVGVRNGTANPLEVAVGIDAITALGIAEPVLADVRVDGNGSSAYRFGLHAKTSGTVGLRVHAGAGTLADAVKRNVRVRPAGRRVESTRATLLEAGRPWRTDWDVTDSKIEPAKLSLAIYPTVLADTLQGFEGLIKEPHGCFEQTSSTMYPMVLALRYMKRNGQMVPEIAAKARGHLDSGYRRLMSYEVGGSGGFELYGRAPAHTMLSAYGLHEFCDMAEVFEIDAGLIPRIQKFLQSRQEKNGSFEAARLGGGASAPIDELATTAYAAWALARSGLEPSDALRCLEDRLDELENDYTRGLAAMAFLTADPNHPTGKALADTLARRARHEGSTRYWEADMSTCVGARGRSADIETTAIAIQVLLASGRHADLIGPAVEWLVAQREPNGRFGSTQSTVLALKALLAADTVSGERGAATIEVQVDGKQVASQALAADAAVPIKLDLAKALPAGKHDVTVAIAGKRRVRVQQTLTTWKPWTGPIKNGSLDLSVDWPARVRVGRDAKLAVTVTNRSDELASLVTLEIGVPPGCSINRAGIVGPRPARVERGEGRLVLYLDGVAAKKSQRFEIPFTARYGLDVSTGMSKAYEYYTPDAATIIPPSRLEAKR